MKIVLLLASALLLLPGAGAQQRSSARPLPTARQSPVAPERSRSAPRFTLPDVHGDPVALPARPGRPIVLNFWAFWCDTWKEELPHLRELAAGQADQDFQLIAISVDGTRLREFTSRVPALPFPVLLDVGGKVSKQYGVAHVPTVFLLDADGRIRFRHEGYPGNHVILRELRQIGKR